MATINLGSIKFKWQGAYNAGTAYTVDDVVSYNGSSYICILASTGNLPTNATYWEQMSSAGTNGTDGTDLTSTLTTQGDILYRDGSGLQRLGAGTAGQALVTGGAGANPSWSSVGGTNTPAFLAYASSNQTISEGAQTKLIFDTERYDTDNAFDNATNYRFTVPSGEGGKYYLYGTYYHGGAQDLFRTTITLYINGSAVHSVHGHNPFGNSSYGDGGYIGVVYDLSAGDYAELFTFVDTSDNSSSDLRANDTGVTNGIYFGGYKIIE